MRLGSRWLIAFSLLVTIRASATDFTSAPAFSTDPVALRHAADAVAAGKHSNDTLLLDDSHFAFEADGGLTETHHTIYRIENEAGVENWSEISGQWEAWHQQKPEIKARIISADGSAHWLDTNTLSDVPVHEDAPDLYTDERRYGGPLPAVAPGAIIETEVVLRDKSPLFAGGIVRRYSLAWSVPSHASRVEISHPEALPLHYETHLLPDATITKSQQNGVETILLEQGALPAYDNEPEHVPPDLALYPQIEFSTGTSWQEVAAEYTRLTAPKLRVGDVESLMSGLNIKHADRSTTIRHIVSALHKNVRYTGVEFGESSLIPQFPSETLQRRYGDCKDKASVLVAMLRSAGIPATLALLEAGPGRDINTNLPGMGMFDHAIVYVPASGNDPELWIDATAQYSQVGTLPWMDYGRWALVVAESTQSLKQIPAITSAQNVHRELREFTLSDYGPAQITETDELTGPEDSDYRDYYSGDTKKIRENSEQYVKEMYLADSLTSLEHGDLSDLEKPAAIKFVTKGRRGDTYLSTAVMAIRVEALFSSLPKYFATKPDDQENAQDSQDDDGDKQKPRTADWWLTPFTTEWHYRILAPAGFKVRAMPTDKTDKVGVLNFSQKYSANPDGSVVEAVLRVESTTTRLSAQEGASLRDAVLKARNSDAIFITFDHAGQSLISSGHIKEGLAVYQRIAEEHPKSALEKTRLAQALLEVGLGEDARGVAQQATLLDPKSALAFSVLGNALKHDLVGRAVEKGMDYEGAIAAYKKSLELDPKDKETRANLALLMEYNPSGIRYDEGAHLMDAVSEWRELKKVDEEYSKQYDDNSLYDLWYAHEYQKLLEAAAALPTSDARKGLVLAATAVQDGVDAALKKSTAMSTDDAERGKALVVAGNLLVRIRKYTEASALISEGARGQSNESQLMRSAEIFSKSKHYEDLAFDAKDPRAVVQKLYTGISNGKLTIDEFKSLTYRTPYDSDDYDPKPFQLTMAHVQAELRSTGLPLTTIADMTLSNMHYTVDGDDALGYKITIESPGSAAQQVYVVRDGVAYKVLAFSVSGNAEPNSLGFLALQELDKNNLAAARTWLDRARDEIHASGGDDPLAGAIFPRLWSKGQDGDATAVRKAALTLIPPKQVQGPYLAALEQVKSNAKSDVERENLTLALALAHSAQQHWENVLPLANELMKASPDSLAAFGLAANAYAQLHRFDDWQKLVVERIKLHPDEMAYLRSSAYLAASRGQFAESRAILKGIMEKGRSNASDLNQYSWYALMLPGVPDQDAIDAAQRANDLTKTENFAILHTFACVEAQAGNTSQARELLLKAMQAEHADEPDSALWFSFGLIAEQYGELDAARKLYGRVEKDKIEGPASTYTIAQQHVLALQKSPTSDSKVAKQ